jgi:hypothetical protein
MGLVARIIKMIFEIRFAHTRVRFVVSTLIFCAVLCSESALSQQAASDTSQGQAALDATPLLGALQAIAWLSPAKHGIELSGTLTRFVGDKSDDAPIRIWAYGPQRFRIEIDSAKGTSSLIVRDGAAKKIAAQKPALNLSRQTAASVHQWIVPWLMFDHVLTSYEVTGTTTSTINEESATGYKLRPSSSSKKALPLTKDIPYDSTFTIWLSAKGLPLRIDYPLPSDDNRFASTAYSRVFKNYQRVEGIFIPMEQEQYIGDQMISRTIFDKAIPNENADDSHFTLPTSEKIK